MLSMLSMLSMRVHVVRAQLISRVIDALEADSGVAIDTDSAAAASPASPTSSPSSSQPPGTGVVPAAARTEAGDLHSPPVRRKGQSMYYIHAS